ncbi:hypothetical protein KR018_008544 [Drosophila ironensis]|nr:hypothetical protein KR018_008544 [Drosophila ironensis]
MSVEALPQNNPLISNFHSMYRFYDFVQVNCSTDFSSLFTQITWYVNGEKIPLVDLLPSTETTIVAHGYKMHRLVSQLNFYAHDKRFHQQQLQQLIQQKRTISPARLTLDLRCVVEIDRYPHLQREVNMSAQLYRDDADLKNQKLTKSRSAAAARTPDGKVHHLALAMTMALAISGGMTAVRLFTPLTFQYGARKSARYKMAATA